MQIVGREFQTLITLVLTQKELVSHQRYVLKLFNAERIKIHQKLKTEGWKERASKTGEMVLLQRKTQSDETEGFEGKRL